jgi:hypothetical protein
MPSFEDLKESIENENRQIQFNSPDFFQNSLN